MIILLHVIAMWYFENKSPFDALWLTLTTITTVGYGDISAASVNGRVATIIMLYSGGIFLLAQAAGDYFEYRNDMREKKIKGVWRWNIMEHIVILNAPATNKQQYFELLVNQLRKSTLFKDKVIQILSPIYPNGLPESLRNQGVIHQHGHAWDVDQLEAINIKDADAIILLAEHETNPASDSQTYDILSRLSDFNLKANIVAECVDDRNRQRLFKAGASTVIRPMRSYPGMMVRALIAPGSEQIIENMFSSSQDECIRIDLCLNNKKWSDIVCYCINEGFGTAIAYQADNDKIYSNPPGDELIKTKAIFLMVPETKLIDTDHIKHLLQQS